MTSGETPVEALMAWMDLYHPGYAIEDLYLCRTPGYIGSFKLCPRSLPHCTATPHAHTFYIWGVGYPIRESGGRFASPFHLWRLLHDALPKAGEGTMLHKTRLPLADPPGFARQMHRGYVIEPMVTPPRVEQINVMPWGPHVGRWAHSWDNKRPIYREPGAPSLSKYTDGDPMIYPTHQEAVEAILIELRAKIARQQGYVDTLTDWLTERNG